MLVDDGMELQPNSESAAGRMSSVLTTKVDGLT